MSWLNIVAVAFIVLSAVCLALIVLQKKNNFFNTWEVIGAQHEMLKNSRIHQMAFYILPLFLSTGLAILFVPDEAFISSMITVVCMLLSILLAALAIIASSNATKVENEDQRKNICEVIKETIFSISYAAYLSVILLIYLLVLFAVQVNSLSPVLAAVLTGVGYYVFVLIVLTLLIIIKRIWKIKELDLR